MDLSRGLGDVYKRQPVPSFGPKLLLGSELADALLFTGQKVMPEILQKSGYTFTHSTLETALRSLLNKPS
jgi:NAD dependent epimerase/dehydratase family enzyme